jgi:quinohemoprotein ethanol dehydrogenase
MRPGLSFLLAGSLLLSIGGCKKSPPATVTDGADWTTYGRTYDEQRFSPLTQINEQTVGRLGLLWSRELGTTHGLEATPLVSNGVIYTTSQWSVAYALDARTGEVLWTFDPKVSRANVRTICCDTVNRGAALYHDKVYLGTLDGRLIALDAKPLPAHPASSRGWCSSAMPAGSSVCAAISPPTTRKTAS